MRPAVSTRPPTLVVARRRCDPFADLVRRVAADPDSPFNIDRYLWVLDEPPPLACDGCGDLFDATVDHFGGPARGLPRRYCSPACRERAAWARRRRRLAGDVDGRWGSAA